MGAKSSKSPPTVDELISLIKNSSLPTVIIEGDDDVIAFRSLEDVYSSVDLSILPAGGRHNVLEIFRRRGELAGKKLAFIADRDSWIMSSIPPEFVCNELIFTRGYSIENDIYVDGDLERLLRGGERAKFNSELSQFLEWYAVAINRHINGGAEDIKVTPQHLLDTQGERARRMALKEGEAFPQATFDNLCASYKTLLRGKSLLALLIRQLSYKGRGANHNQRQLIEQVATQRGAIMTDHFSRVGAIFGVGEEAAG